MSKIGLFITDSAPFPNIREWYPPGKRHPRVTISMKHDPDLWREIKGDTFLVGRRFFNQQPYSILHKAIYRMMGRELSRNIRTPFKQEIDDPIELARALFNEMLPDVQKMHGIYDAWVFICEPTCYNGERAQKLAALHREWSRLMHGIGEKTVAYYFSTGHPGQNAQDLENLWKILANHGCDYIGLNGYDAPTCDHTGGDWTIGRHRKIRAAIAKTWYPQVPFIYIEGFIDGGVSWVNRPRVGWKGFCKDATEYLNEHNLQWVDSVLADPDVIGGALFCHDGDIWNSFAVADQMAIRDYILKEDVSKPPINYPDIANKQYPAKDVRAVGIAAMVLRAKIAQPKVAIAIVLAESGGNSQAVGTNPDGSIDRGLVQINNKWHPKISDECAFNPMCSILQMAILSKNGTDYTPWATYKLGTYKQFLGIAELALAQLGIG